MAAMDKLPPRPQAVLRTLDEIWAQGAMMEAFSDASIRNRMREATNIFRVLIKTLLKAGITTEREEGTRKFICLRRAELDERFPGLIDAVVRDFVAS